MKGQPKFFDPNLATFLNLDQIYQRIGNAGAITEGAEALVLIYST